MWQNPKTDWKSTDTYDIHIALTRVEGNLHEIVALLGVALSSEHLEWAMTDFPTAAEMHRIQSNLAAAYDAHPLISAARPSLGEQFDADTANEWELAELWLWRVANERSVLLEAEKATVLTMSGEVITSQGTNETYQSNYTGSQIDQFVAQIKEWNNGRL